MGSFLGRGNQYIRLVKVLHCKLPSISNQLHKAHGWDCQAQEWGEEYVIIALPWPLMILLLIISKEKFKVHHKQFIQHTLFSFTVYSINKRYSE